MNKKFLYILDRSAIFGSGFAIGLLYQAIIGVLFSITTEQLFTVYPLNIFYLINCILSGIVAVLFVKD